MLCEFSFGNYRSFRDPTTMNLQAKFSNEMDEGLICADGDGLKLVPVAAIYGPNAGGKSNVIKALGALLDSVCRPIRILVGHGDSAKTKAADPTRYFEDLFDPFLFDSESESKPSWFEVLFRVEGDDFHFRIMKGPRGIEYELLERRDAYSDSSDMIYERVDDSVEVGDALSGISLQRGFNRAIPFLVYLYLNGDYDIIEEVASFFLYSLLIDYSDAVYNLALRTLPPRSISADPIPFLKAAGIGIEGFRIEEGDPDRSSRILATHKNSMGEAFELPFEEESAGSRKMAVLASMLPSILHDGGILLVDELDVQLHPKLLRFIIRIFKNQKMNPNGAQLIFSCQDVSVMRNDVFRRDEVWFANRNDGLASELWSLADMRDSSNNPLSKHSAYDKKYLRGEFGAIPILDPDELELFVVENV